jgi:hypothetical protein
MQQQTQATRCAQPRPASDRDEVRKLSALVGMFSQPLPIKQGAASDTPGFEP